MGRWLGRPARRRHAIFPLEKKKTNPTQPVRARPYSDAPRHRTKNKQTNKQTNKINKQNQRIRPEIRRFRSRPIDKQTNKRRSTGRAVDRKALRSTAKTSSVAIPPIIMRSQLLMYHWNPGKASKIL